MLKIGIAAQAHDVPEQHAALSRIEHVLDCWSKKAKGR